MRRIHATIAVATLVLAGVACGRSTAGNDLDLASHLPADALLYVSLDDLGKAWERFPETRLGRIFSDPKVMSFFERLAGGSGTSGITIASTTFGLPVLIGSEKKLSQKPGRVSVGVVPGRKGSDDPGLVASIALGGSKGELVEILNSLLAQLHQANPSSCSGKLESHEHTIGEVCVLDVRLSYFWVGGNLVVGTKRSDLDAVLASLKRADAEPGARRRTVLAESPEFRDLRRRTGATSGGTFLYGDPRFLLRKLSSADRREAKILGLSEIGGFAMNARTVEDGLAEAVMRLSLRRPRGIFQVLGDGRKPFRLPTAFPEQVLFSVSGRIDADALVRLTTRMSGPNELQVQTPLALNRPWTVELVDSIGEEAGLWLSSAAFGTFHMGLVAELRNPLRARRALIVGLRSGKQPLAKIIRVRGQMYFHLKSEGTGPDLRTITIHGDRLYAGTSIGVIRDMIRRSADPKARSLGASSTFRDAVAWAPADASAILYVDTPRLFRWGYEMASPFVILGLNISRKNADPNAKPISGLDFPPAETFTKHLTPAVTWVRRDETGLTAHTRSAVMGEVPVFSGLAGVGFALLYLVREEEPAAQQVDLARPGGPWKRPVPPPTPRDKIRDQEQSMLRGCRTNLSFFRRAFIVYRKQNAGKAPPSLAAFYGKGPAQGPHFICPADVVAWATWKKDRQALSSYVYIGSVPPGVARPDFILVWDRMPYHGGKRSVLFLDGSIRLLGEGEFQRLLAETRRSQRR